MSKLLRFPFSVILLPALVAGHAARAQNLDDFADVIVEEPQAARAANELFEVSPKQFDQWVFGGTQSAAERRRHLRSQLTLHVQAINEACGLSDAQRAKLELAGTGDIKRFFDAVETIRREFMEVRRDQEKFNQIWQKMSPLRIKMNTGMFDQDSLVYKVLHNTLEPEQLTSYQSYCLERRRFQYRASVAMVVASLENGIPLREQQRQAFIGLILDETAPPRTFGKYDYQVVLYKAAHLPEEELKAIFDDGQWRAMQACFGRAKAMERMLRKNELIP